MLSTIFYRISAVATNVRKNVEEAFTPKTPIITSTEPVFITNTITASPTLEHTPVVCESVEPTATSPKLMRENSIMNMEEGDCSGDCANCDCKKTVVPDVEDCGQNSVVNMDILSSTMPRVCSKSACDCIVSCDVSGAKTENYCDLSGNCYNGNNECCSNE